MGTATALGEGAQLLLDKYSGDLRVSRDKKLAASLS